MSPLNDLNITIFNIIVWNETKFTFNIYTLHVGCKESLKTIILQDFVIAVILNDYAKWKLCILHYLNSMQSDKILQNFAKVYNDICNRTLLLESRVSWVYRLFKLEYPVGF